MFHRRDFLTRTLGGSSLLAVGGVVPEFLARTAAAADKAKGKETVLVVVEMTGGNDGLNTVIPYADDLYHKARPTLGMNKKQVLALDGYHGLHPRLNFLKTLFDQKQLAVVQGVGYPNPDRSHFESMDIWQLADPRRQHTTGWLARTIPAMTVSDAGVPGMYIGTDRLPLALQGADGGAISLADRSTFKLNLTGPAESAKGRKSLIEDLNSDAGTNADLASFVQKRQLQTYTSLQRIEEALKEPGTAVAGGPGDPPNVTTSFSPNRGGLDLNSLAGKMALVGRLIQKGLGTRIYYVSIAGFDTHSRQGEPHADLLGETAQAIQTLFDTLKPGGDDQRVCVMTYSEFGRRVRENGSRGTDHGAASCMFVAGPKVNGGIVGKHPKLDDLADGDLRFHTDFRRVYSALLKDWLGVDARATLGGDFDPLPLIKKA